MNVSLAVMYSAEQCVVCPKGTYCPVGSAGATPCAAGTYNAAEEQEACGNCAAGSFQPLPGNTTCLPCTPGYYCAEGAAAALPCPGGTHKNASLEVMTSSDQCVVCPAGTFCSVGSDVPTDCAPGTYTDEEEQSTCSNCAAGKFQAAAGQTECDTCTEGNYCAEGSAAPLPCPGGRHKNQSIEVMSSVDDCVVCPAGTFCPVGSDLPTACAPGSYTDVDEQAACASCEAGTFQDANGATACKSCSRGNFCAAGAATPVPCPPGTVGGESGQSSATQCLPVQPGFWAPTGTADAEPCPESGFYCPGAALDPLYNGSKPIVNKVGKQTQSRTEEVEVTKEVTKVESQMELDMTMDDFEAERAALIAALALQYGVPASAIQLSASAGSLVLDFSIDMSLVEGDATSEEVAAAMSNLDNDALSAALGVNITLSAPPSVTVETVTTTELITTMEELDCPAGFWCSAGSLIPCGKGTYNPEINVFNQAGCLLCPLHSDTLGTNSTSIWDCLCEPNVDIYGQPNPPGYYNALNDSVLCKACPVGTNCSVPGASIYNLPISPGYYRASAGAIDIKRCHDAAENCTGDDMTSECAQSSSGCLGGDDPDRPCRPSLGGKLCQLCNASGARYVKADETHVAHCEPCENDTLMVVGILLGAVAAFCLLLWLVPRVVRRMPMVQIFKTWVATEAAAFSLGNKIKILVGFWQIVTKISRVYDISFPGEVLRLMDVFKITVNLGSPLPFAPKPGCPAPPPPPLPLIFTIVSSPHTCNITHSA